MPDTPDTQIGQRIWIQGIGDTYRLREVFDRIGANEITLDRNEVVRLFQFLQRTMDPLPPTP